MRRLNLIPKRLKEEMKYANIPMKIWLTIPAVLILGIYIFPLFLTPITSVLYTVFLEIFVIYLFIHYHKHKNSEVVIDYLKFMLRRKIYRWSV